MAISENDPLLYELEDDPDLEIIAEQITAARRKLGLPTPHAANLATAMQSLTVTDVLRGASSFDVEIADDDWLLLDSGFFDAQKNGRLDAIDVNYPKGSPYWWRMSQLVVNGNQTMTITFMERLAMHLMLIPGPKKASRAKMTRAEFIKSLCDDVKAFGGIEFVSHDLHVHQPTDAGKEKPRSFEPTTLEERKARKEKGINNQTHLKIKGVPATAAQLDQVNRALDQAAKDNAGPLATKALIIAGIGESDFRPVVNNLGFGGVFQGQVETGGHFFNKDETEREAHYFLVGGLGFQGGGAIKLAAKGLSAGEIATTVEGGGATPEFYGVYGDEADKLIEAYGGHGGAGGTPNRGTYAKQFNFEIGGPNNPHEHYWEGMNRLAADVNWPLFVDGQRMFFDPETTLIEQMPVAVIDRDDPAVVDWSVTWDKRQIATEMRLTILCKPFDFRAGHVFLLTGFGPASTGSTVKLPGRWLVSEMIRHSGSLTAEFTLIQPHKPNPEPAPEIAQRQSDESRSSGQYGGSTGDKAGSWKYAPGVPRTLNKKMVSFMDRVATFYDGTLVVTTTTDHSKLTDSGNYSDHNGGGAADLGSVANWGGQVDGQGGFKIAIAGHRACGESYAEAVKHANVPNYDRWPAVEGGVQILWRVPGHHDHVHFGIGR